MASYTVSAERFAQMPEWLLNDLSVPSDALRIYGFLRRYADREENKAWPYRKTLADRADFSLRHLDRMIRHLERVHAIEVTRRITDGKGSVASHYHLLSYAEKLAKDEQDQRTGGTEADPEDIHMPVRGATVESLGGGWGGDSTVAPP